MPPDNELLEIGKLLLDLFKQMIALDTAMLVGVITIVEKVFQTKKVLKSRWGTWTLAISLLCFVLSLFLSVGALLEITNNLSRMLQGVPMSKWVSDFLLYSSMGLFFLGILSFIFLTVRSFWLHSERAPK